MAVSMSAELLLPERGDGSPKRGWKPQSTDRPRTSRERNLIWQTGSAPGRRRVSPPEGHVNWTLHLLADKVVEMEFAGSISLETVRQILKKTNSSRGRRRNGASPS